MLYHNTTTESLKPIMNEIEMSEKHLIEIELNLLDENS